ncbi:hypothetical protein CK203_084599 [Vitis vinifera]|uniref:CCHC-type domain-containing protein n=1 Tax=Vitis vinifera TaxID=29760 RepID=A0A438DKG1_VITVI|nr:hypothetical protein CK203_084599 [Vitis vinifera]
MPETTEPGFRKWKIENSMIMSWLINSMNNDIGENFLLLNQLYMTSAKESSQLLSITTHSQATYRQIVEQKETVQVLPRTKQELDDVEAESWALNPCQVSGRLFQSSGGDRQKRDRPWCDYCKKPGHYKETCWKLHGKPADWKPKPRFDRDGRAHVAANSESTSVPEPSPFNKEQMEMLQKLLSQVGSGSTTGVAFTANRGGMRPVDSRHRNLKSGKMIGSAEPVFRALPPFMWPILKTKSLKQVAYSLRVCQSLSNSVSNS